MTEQKRYSFFVSLLYVTDQYVSLVRVRFFSFLGNEQKLVKQEERSLVFRSL